MPIEHMLAGGHKRPYSPWPDRARNLPRVLLELPSRHRLRAWWLTPHNVQPTWRAALARGLEKIR